MFDLSFIQQSQADSLANAIGSQLGSLAAGWLVVGMGLANKWLMTVGMKATGLVGKLPDWMKAMVALAFAQFAAWVSQFVPFVGTELDALPVYLTGGLVWLVSMGWHSVLKVLMPKAASN